MYDQHMADPKKEFAKKMKDRVERAHPAFQANEKELSEWGITLRTPSEIQERKKQCRRKRRKKKGRPNSPSDATVPTESPRRT